MELSTTDPIPPLRRAVAGLLHRQVSVTVGWSGGAGPLVCLSGSLDGLVDVPVGEDAPLALVVGGQDVVLWPDELAEAAVVRASGDPSFSVEFESGLAISVDCAD